MSAVNSDVLEALILLTYVVKEIVKIGSEYPYIPPHQAEGLLMALDQVQEFMEDAAKPNP